MTYNKNAPSIISGDDFLLPWPHRLKHAFHALLNTDFSFACPPTDAPPHIKIEIRSTANGTPYRVFHLDGHQGSFEMHIGGMRSNYNVMRHMFDAYEQMGKPAMFVELPAPTPPSDNIQSTRDVVAHVLKHPPIPLKHRGKDLSLSTHSTSAALLLETLMENKNGEGQTLLDKHKRLICYSTFLMASFVKNPIANNTYWYTHVGKDSIFGQSLSDRFYCAAMCLMGYPGPGKKLARLRHFEIQHMSYAEAFKFASAVFGNDVPSYLQDSSKLTLVHGADDWVACFEEAQKAREKLGCNWLKMENTAHNPFSRERAVKLIEHFHEFAPVMQPRESINPFGPIKLPTFKTTGESEPTTVGERTNIPLLSLAIIKRLGR